MGSDFSLLVYGPVLDSGKFVASLGPVSSWRRSIRSMGGFWQGSCTISADSGIDLFDAFYQWLGYHVRERSAEGVTWEGMVYEMEIEHAGSRRRRSLDLMANAVDVSYQDDGEIGQAAFSTQAQSIAQYGRKEEILSGDNMPVATAQALRDRYLAGNAWPWARPVALGAGDTTRLEIRACGYAFTANWLYVQAGDGAEHDIDHWISAVVGTAEGLSSDHGGSVSGAGDCQFLQAGNLGSNTLQVREEAQSDQRPWSLLEDLAGLGDSSGDPWRVWVDLDRLLHYQAIDLDPRYFLRDGGLYNTGGGQVAIDPWALKPGIVRDLGYPIRRADPGSSFADARDQYAEEIEVSASGAISLKTALFDEADLLAAQAGYGGEG